MEVGAGAGSSGALLGITIGTLAVVPNLSSSACQSASESSTSLGAELLMCDLLSASPRSGIHETGRSSETPFGWELDAGRGSCFLQLRWARTVESPRRTRYCSWSQRGTLAHRCLVNMSLRSAEGLEFLALENLLS